MSCDFEQSELDTATAEIKAFADQHAQSLAERAGSETASTGKQMGDDSLAGAAGAAIGAAIGSSIGPGGTAAGGIIGREIGNLFVIDIEMRPTRFSLDLPSVSMQRQDVAFDLPSVTIRNRDIIFHTPSVRMVRRKTGEYPEVTCGGFMNLQCTVKWSPIYTDVPEPFMEEQRVVVGVPEITMVRQDMSFDAPVVDMATQEFVFDVPHITIRTKADIADNAKDAADQLSAKYKVEAANLARSTKELSKEKIIPKLSALFGCFRRSLEQQLVMLPQQFDPGINMLNESLANMQSRSVPTDDDDYVRLVQSRDALMAKRNEVVRDLESKIAELVEKERGSINQILSS